MFRRYSATLAVVLLGVGIVWCVVPESSVEASIVGSKHDMSGQGWGESTLCAFCHATHASNPVPNMPLWNRQLSTATYAIYSSSSLNATPGQPGDQSKLCLSCHDGTIAVDSYGGKTGSNFIGNGGMMGTDFSNDHPVSFTYDANLAAADGGLKVPFSTTYVDAASTLRLFDGKMECSSCHAVHNSNNGKFLRVSNQGSALCLGCHVK